jgi:hypothetical protein
VNLVIQEFTDVLKSHIINIGIDFQIDFNSFDQKINSLQKVLVVSK